jgi:hypothetical protein
MISYIKIYGPPLMEAIKSLRNVAVDMPEVCIMDTTISDTLGSPGGAFMTEVDTVQMVTSYFDVDIDRERCNTIISKSGESLGEYDFFFEWFKDPTQDEVNDLIERIDKAIASTGAKYTITTK